jgi:hypothetical protein
VQAPPATRKELHYFDHLHLGGFTERDALRYHDHFPRPEGVMIGEWTPLYATASWIPAMLAEAAPQAKLLVLVRDPVERYLSGLQRHYRQATVRASALDQLAPLDAFVRGLYHVALTALLACFPREQVLVLQYERCTLDTHGELRRTFHFLDLPDADFAIDADAHPNRQPDKPALRDDARAAFVRAYEPDVLRLAADFTEIDLTLWPNFAHLAG